MINLKKVRVKLHFAHFSADSNGYILTESILKILVVQEQIKHFPEL